MNANTSNETRIGNLLKAISLEMASASQDPLFEQALEFMENRELGLAFEYFAELALKNNITSPSVLDTLFIVGSEFNYPAETGASKELWNDLLALRDKTALK